MYFCATCGAYTAKRCFLLGRDCPMRKIVGGPTTLRRIYEGNHLHYRDEAARLSVSSRRGAACMQYAASLPPPPEVRQPQRGLESLPQTPGMLALVARIQAREAAARAEASHVVSQSRGSDG